ncbi:peptide-N4-asparagine amidase [Pelomonas sp. SE-A7]|uniref:peptide-N4-asparagine amidase n=1 Tax=Pelomonas sp. SE-A7 TaxID=3054953 RepID=UPI00259CB6DC|nr:peptide-N4-asparagine amidase [Pelomonas sp. SE-A7]MDM4768082.1 hypothetical protein [Pelomonas sp. SE-A7]
MERGMRRMGVGVALAACLIGLGGCGGGAGKDSGGAALPASDLAPLQAIQAINVGSTDPTHAEPALPRPGTTPCVVTLYQGLSFNDFNQRDFSYQPPALCQGAWAKVVLEADYSVTAGRQFDRTALIGLGGVNLYYGTTPQPTASLARSWKIERDVTEFAALLRTPQAGAAVLDTVVNATYTGVFTGSARLLFYPAVAGEPLPSQADQVLAFSAGASARPLAQQRPEGGYTRSFRFPLNTSRVYLDLIAQGQSSNEYWYACAPTELAAALGTCGDGAYREVQVLIDDQPAGLAPIFPWVFSGGHNPRLWLQTTGVQTLQLQPYRVDLSPFAPLLADGANHSVRIKVLNSRAWFNLVGSLLVYRDAGVERVTGQLTENSLKDLNDPSKISNQLKLPSGAAPSGLLQTLASRDYRIAGYQIGSRGREQVTVAQQTSFSNLQTYSATQLEVVQQTRVEDQTLVERGGKTQRATRSSSYPFRLLYVSEPLLQRIAVEQQFQRSQWLQDEQRRVFFSQVENAVTADIRAEAPAAGASAVQTQSTAQRFDYSDSALNCASRRLLSKDGKMVEARESARCATAPRPAWYLDPLGLRMDNELLLRLPLP